MESAVNNENGERYTSRENYVPAAEDAIKDFMAFSQEYVQENYENGSVKVSRGIQDDLAEQAKQAKENGESLEIDPRAMESWSESEDAAEEWGEVVLNRELDADDAAFYGPAVIPREFEDREITALGNEPYEISPEDIEVVE